jgi:hypothetical protein
MAAAAPDLRFREHVSGWISFDARDYNTAVVDGRRARNRCALDLTIEIDDLDRFLHGPVTPGRLGGAVRCPALGGELEIEDGTFNLFVRAPDARRRRVLYRGFASDRHGRPLTVSAFKLIEDDPNHDVWRDCSRLLTRILAGHVSHSSEQDDDPRVVATGVLVMRPLRFLRTVLTMRGGPGRRLSAPVIYQVAFVHRLRQIYGGRALPEYQFAFPSVTPGRTAFQGRQPNTWHELPGRPELDRQILPFETADGCELNLHRIKAAGADPGDKPVLLIGGLAMRANSFYDTPSRRSLVDALIEEGHDVWVENWRTSPDLPARDYTLDHAAVYDHPKAVRTVCDVTGRDELDAVAHCMGSASLTMSVLAGLVPALRRVVSSAVSLHIDLDRRSKLRLATLVPAASVRLKGTDPQWAARAPSVAAAGLARWGRFVCRTYPNPLNALTTYVYGGKPEGLWQRANLDDETLDWLGREFGYAPFSFFRQMRRCSDVGHLVPVEGLPELDVRLDLRPPPEGTSFTFIAGSENRFFLPGGQRTTYEHFARLQPDTHEWVPVPGYGHFDLFVGRNAEDDVFPHILGALNGVA